MFLVCLLLICGATAFTGIVPTRLFGHDDFFWLSNGWRVVCGQRPHIDFYSPWGPVMYLLVGFGMLISNASPNAIGYASAMMGLLVGLWVYALGRGRLGTLWRVLFGLYLTLLVTAPYALGTRPTWTTHAMVHNRYGFALVGLVLLECLQRTRGRDETAGEFWGGVSTGAAIAAALCLKASFFFVTLPILGVSLVLRGLNWQRLGGLAGGFCVVAAALLSYVSFDITRMLQDLHMAAIGRSKAMQPWDLLDILRSQVPTLAVVVALYMYGSPARREKSRWLEGQELLIWGLLVFFADAMLIFSNMQARGTPLSAAFGFIVASRMSAQRAEWRAPATPADKSRYVFVLLLCSFLSLPQFCADLAGLGYGAWEKAYPSPDEGKVRFSAPRLAPMILYDGAPDQRGNGSVYTGRINAGIALLKEQCTPADRVLNMDMVNPFPYALGWQPPHGGVAAVGYNYLFTDESHPTAEEYFGDATVVMVPKEPALWPSYYNGYFRIYQPGLLERFHLVAETKSWWLYKRK